MSENLPANMESPIIDLVPVSPEALQRQVNAIQQAMKQVMEEGVHFGKVPGCGDKPTLLKPGAEKICLLFRLVPEFRFEERQHPNNHVEVITTCLLKDMTGRLVGQGIGSCSTFESKYRYRLSERVCPSCEAAALIRSTDFKTKEPNGWLCFHKKGGCGAKFPLGSEEIEGQKVGKVENPDIADQLNTVRKISKKRAHVDATIIATGASDIFTQDIEDMDIAPAIDVTPPAAKVSNVVPADKLEPKERKAGPQPTEEERYFRIDNAPEEIKEKLYGYMDNHCTWDLERSVWVCKKKFSPVAELKLKPFQVFMDKKGQIVEVPFADDDVPANQVEMNV